MSVLNEKIAFNLCVDTASEAGDLSLQLLKQRREITKKTSTDFVTDADLAVEKLIVEKIGERFPDHDFLTEEKLSHDSGSPYLWVIDPIDGTMNYVAGIPPFSVSIALVIDGVITVGAVYDPVHGEMFAARRGHGATLNGEPIRVSTQGELEQSMGATEFNRLLPFLAEYATVFAKLPKNFGNLRLLGSTCLDLAYIASGRLDLLFLFTTSPWDIAAGALLIEEAGGKVTGWNRPFNLFQEPSLIGGNERLVDQFHERMF